MPRVASPLVTTPIVVDSDAIAQVGYDTLAAFYPGWQPATGEADFTTRFIQTFAAMVAENQTLATRAVYEIVEHLGRTLGLPPFAATYATASSTWSLNDTLGHTIPAGTQVALVADDGTPVTFYVQSDVTVPGGLDVTEAGEVILVALQSGIGGSGITGNGTILDRLAFADSLELVGQSTGGQDAEDIPAYLTRFDKFARLIGPRPILAPDHALFLQVFFPTKVQRALAIDMYNADTEEDDIERCVTTIPIDSAGQPPNSGDQDEMKAALLAKRESTFLEFVIDPTYTTVDVDFVGVAESGYDPDGVRDQALEAVAFLVSPANHGVPKSGDQSVWENQPVLYFQDFVTALNNVQGFARYTTLTIGVRRPVTAVAASDIATSTAHGFTANQPVVFRGLAGGTPLVNGTTYYARDITTDTFKVSATAGGSAINLTTDITVGTVTGVGTDDLDLAGLAPLPTPGEITGEVA